jgi:superoxide dismutase, Cu-Zn family
MMSPLFCLPSPNLQEKIMHRLKPLQSAAGAATVVAVSLSLGCGAMKLQKPDALAELGPASGSQVAGVVTFTRLAAGGVHIEGDITGLTPGEHGFHVHEVGDCSAPDATSAKGHFNPGGKPHGGQDGEHHAGDMINLTADADGKAHYAADFSALEIGSGEGNIIGRAVVVHAAADDYKTQPAGNSGKRVACGMIKAS